jgi:ribosome-associated protein
MLPSRSRPSTPSFNPQPRSCPIATRKKSVPAAIKATLRLVETSLDADKAEDIVAVDLADKTSIADYMVIATGRSARQLVSMADHIVETLKAKGIVAPVEGRAHGEWILVDAGDVIVHLFRPEARTHYALEKMWDVLLPEADRAMVVA